MTLLKTSRAQLIGANLVLSLSILGGCATTGTDGAVQIGPDTYMIGGLGKFTDFSSSGVKARMFQDAAKFCTDKQRVMVPLGSTGKDSGVATYASAEVQFQCLLPNDPRVVSTR